ncbi:group III truncated hemoglobin [Fulvivirga lutimaris]|uniref:group III truncated hemoglobin n=1 Tax=Fulvivirga lutimaris TaxID=1819566 RepID=UPI0012BB5F96|nr:group III truncated hemoglobin [Fulvivirga lutimaris]MTI41800.1 group III truncated hemoglobin [Fulvivirga lutimaris]
MGDISNRKDIESLMDSFYQKVINNKDIGFLFTDVAKLNLKKHLPIICDFWESTLFQKTIYKGNVLAVHQDLNEQHALTEQHFQVWLEVFNTTVDELFKGNNAEQIKIRALSIATVMRSKILHWPKA